MRVPPTITTYLRYSDFNGNTASTLEQFESALRNLSLENVLGTCSALNMLTANWDFGYDKDLQAQLMREFLPSTMADAAIRTGRPIFHRHQLLFTLREALKHCAGAQARVTHPNEIGELLLMANDHLGFEVSRAVDVLDRIADIIRICLPSVEASRLSSYVNTLARGTLMITRFLEPRRGTADFVDMCTIFEKVTGVPLDSYFALLWGTMSRFTERRLANALDVGRFQVPMGWFRETKVPSELVESFFSEVSAPVDDLAKRAKQGDFQRDDFVLFKDKPFIKTPFGLLPLDLTYVAEKFYSGPFWRVNFGLPSDDREPFHSFWGKVFEDYVTWLLREACTGSKNVFIADPRFASDPNEQVSDALIVCGRAAMLIEYKGNTFRSASKYGLASDEIRAELEQKLVTGSGDSRKGVRQLANAVERLCRYDNPDGIAGVDFFGIAKVFPVMIIRDDIGSVFGMNSYLNERFQSFKPKGLYRSVTPLFCFSANDIEMLSSYLSTVPLVDLIETRYRRDKSLSAPFWMVETDLIKRFGKRKPAFVRVALDWLRDNTMSILGIEPSDATGSVSDP